MAFEEPDWDDAEVERSAICGICGVSTLPPEIMGEDAICENASCDGYGEPVANVTPSWD